MLRDKLHKQHRRNRSQLHFTKAQLSKETEKAHHSKSQGVRHHKGKVQKHRGNAELVHKLVAKSVKKVPHKQIIIEDIEGDAVLQEHEEFFQFGKKAVKTPATNIHLMEEILEVPDTGNYSQRQTEDYPDNKQNRTDHLNLQKGVLQQNLRISVDKIPMGKRRDEYSQRIHDLSSKRSKSSRDNNCSLSTLQIKAGKSKGKSKANVAKKGLTAEVDKQIKLIWDCISDIWIQNRITQKNSHQNSERIEDLQKKSELYQKELLQLKMAMGEGEKTNNFCFK